MFKFILITVDNQVLFKVLENEIECSERFKCPKINMSVLNERHGLSPDAVGLRCTPNSGVATYRNRSEIEAQKHMFRTLRAIYYFLSARGVV